MYLYQTELSKRRLTLVSDKITWIDDDRVNPCRCPEDIWQVCKDFLRMDKKAEEYIWGLFFDSRCNLIGMSQISHGGVNQAYLSPREVYIKSLLAGAVSVAVVHNHPSGDPAPSEEDRDITVRLAKAGNILGVTLIEHMIIGANSFYSFKSQDPDRLDVHF